MISAIPRPVVVLAMLSLIASSCRTFDQASTPKHEFGNTTRPGGELSECQTAGFSDYQQADAYLKDITAIIMKANPATFQGDYAPQHFCIGTVPDDSANAVTIANTRAIAFHDTLLKLAHNDAEVAAVLSHELAHITMQHDHDLIHPLVAKDKDWLALNAEITKAMPAYRQAAEIYYKKLNALDQQVTDLLDSMLDAMPQPYGDERQSTIKAIGTYRQQCRSAATTPSLAEKALSQLALAYGLTTSEERDMLFIDNNRPAPDTPAAESCHRRADELWGKWQGLEAQLQKQQGKRFTQRQSVIQQVDTWRRSPLPEQIVVDNLRQKQQARVSALLGAEEEANWTEREADEVGFELYLRAGFHPAQYTWLHTQRMNDEDRRACLAAVNAAMTNPSLGSLIVRGTESHPAPCWRYYNIVAVEAAKHAIDYKPLLTATQRVDVDVARFRQMQLSLPASSTAAAPPPHE